MFKQLHKYIVRIRELGEVFTCVSHYNRLDKICIGGSNGNNYTSSIRNVYDEFKQSLLVLEQAEYSVHDLTVK